MPTLCAVTVRQIKPGTYDEFRKVWAPDPWMPNLTRALIMRHEDDENQILSIGFFDASQADVDAMRDDPDFLAREEMRLRRISEFEESVMLNGIYELADDVMPPS